MFAHVIGRGTLVEVDGANVCAMGNTVLFLTKLQLHLSREQGVLGDTSRGVMILNLWYDRKSGNCEVMHINLRHFIQPRRYGVGEIFKVIEYHLFTSRTLIEAAK